MKNALCFHPACSLLITLTLLVSGAHAQLLGTKTSVSSTSFCNKYQCKKLGSINQDTFFQVTLKVGTSDSRYLLTEYHNRQGVTIGVKFTNHSGHDFLYTDFGPFYPDLIRVYTGKAPKDNTFTGTGSEETISTCHKKYRVFTESAMTHEASTSGLREEYFFLSTLNNLFKEPTSEVCQ